MVREERREQPRTGLAMPARVRQLSTSQPAMVRDLSTAGCRLEVVGFSLLAGNRVLIRPAGFESLLGTVVWSNATQAGVKFDEALASPTVERFCAIFPETSTSVLLDIAA